MVYTFKQAEKAFKDDRITELGKDKDGQRYLKLRSLSRKAYMEELFFKAGISVPNKPSKFWLQELFESERITDSKIDKTIKNLYEKGRRERRNQENSLINELYKLKAFDWGGLHQNSLEKTIVDNYVKKIQSFARLNECVDNELHNSMRAYVLSSWYNHWTSIIIEDIFKDHPKVLPAVGLIKKVDFFIKDIPFDLKVTYFPEGYLKETRKEKGLDQELKQLKSFCRKHQIHFDRNMPESKLLPDLWEKALDHPSKEGKSLIRQLKEDRVSIIEEAISEPQNLARWLYENQGTRRFDASNRIFLMLVDYNNFFESWKLKRAKPLLDSKISNHLEALNHNPGFSLNFSWEDNSYSVITDIIFINHNR